MGMPSGQVLKKESYREEFPTLGKVHKGELTAAGLAKQKKMQRTQQQRRQEEEWLFKFPEASQQMQSKKQKPRKVPVDWKFAENTELQSEHIAEYQRVRDFEEMNNATHKKKNKQKKQE